MSKWGYNVLLRFKKRWQLMQVLEILLYALGSAGLVYFLSKNIIFSSIIFAVVCISITLYIKPWQLSLAQVSSYIDSNLKSVEYSSGLLLLPEAQLSSLAKLQKEKVTLAIKENIKGLKPKTNLARSVIICSLLILSGILINHFKIFEGNTSPSTSPEENKIVFKPKDSASIKITPPVLTDQLLTIQYPSYTNTPPFSTSKMDIEALEGSLISWKIKFSTAVDSVILKSNEGYNTMRLKGESYYTSKTLKTSNFYNFKFNDTLGGSYVSELFAIEAIKDKAPVIKIDDLTPFTTFTYNDKKLLRFNTTLTDDFGIAQAAIIATVSKGSGESVKFREEQLSFDNTFTKGAKQQQLSKSIDLDKLKMEPGDELYFYITTSDFKSPNPNTTRSETFFAVIQDTTTYDFAVEGTMGVDLMPAYFRSQRQLIIDTEKLIAEKPELQKQVFNSRSNALGYDQKSLRLKYGEFMGDEAESGIQKTEAGDLDQEHQSEEEDPLAEYSHNHDSDNEHNLVDHSQENHEEDDDEDPLHDYLHNHDDPEESTLFTQSLKSKLRQALNVMWDAELHLRLYEPQKSLPYQYRALKLLQEIKNSARIYVHRIGFDPPPIKEDKRLTGDIDEVSNFRKKEDFDRQYKFEHIHKTISRLEEIISNNEVIFEGDRKLFEQAGSELAELAIQEPGNYLDTLKKLKWLTEVNDTDINVLSNVQQELMRAIPFKTPIPTTYESASSKLNQLLLLELENNE